MNESDRSLIDPIDPDRSDGFDDASTAVDDATRTSTTRRDARAIDRSSAIPDADEGEGDERDDGRMLDVDVDDADDLGGGANRW
jgi:hypothetical protein|tara:strand:+ start:18748 stop:18999 length:252 start_codon:yes stop_codon:yes gene_type:complete